MNNTTQDKAKKNEDAGYYSNRPLFGGNGSLGFRKKLGKGLTVFIVIASCILFYFALLRLPDISGVLKKILKVLKPIIYGLAIAYLLNPIVKFVELHLKTVLDKKISSQKQARAIARGVGVFTAIAILLFVVIALFNMMIPELYTSIRSMVLTVPRQLNQLVNRFMEMNSKNTTLSRFLNSILKEGTEYIQTWMRSDLLNKINILMSNLTVGVINIVSELANAVIGIIVSIYVLFNKDKFAKQSKKIVYAVFKPAQANMILHLTVKSNEMFGGFIIGKIIDSVIVGVLCFFGLSLLKMPYVMLVSVVMAVTNIIPFFGPYMGAIPSAILIMLTDFRMGVYFVIFIVILQQLDGNVIEPKILGDKMGLSSFWVIFSILLGGGLFGIPGMILGAPTFAVIYYIVSMLINHMLEKKKLPIDTAVYGEKSYVDTDGQFMHAEEKEI